MATKQELETQVAELEAKLAAAEAEKKALVEAKPADVVVNTADLNDDQITAKIAELKVEFEKQIQDLTTAKDLAEVQQAKIADDLITERKTVDELEIAHDEIKLALTVTERDRDRLEKELAVAKGGIHLNNAVVLDGVSYKVVKQERVADLCEQFRKKMVDDNDLALVIVKA